MAKNLGKLTKEPKFSKEEMECCLKKWDEKGYTVGDAIIYEICKMFPDMHSLHEVHYKVKIINYLYSTRLSGEDTSAMAEHICSIPAIDEKLKHGGRDKEGMRVVEEIAALKTKGAEKPKRYISFASKFCSFHNPEVFPIYDKYALEMLWILNQRFHLVEGATKTQMQSNYLVYADIALKLMQQSSFIDSLKQQDQYLWMFAISNWNK